MRDTTINVTDTKPYFMICQEVIKYLRDRNISNSDVARRLGISAGAVANQLSGRKPFGNRAADKWASCFPFNREFLQFGTGTLEKDSEKYFFYNDLPAELRDEAKNIELICKLCEYSEDPSLETFLYDWKLGRNDDKFIEKSLENYKRRQTYLNIAEEFASAILKGKGENECMEILAKYVNAKFNSCPLYGKKMKISFEDEK